MRRFGQTLSWHVFVFFSGRERSPETSSIAFQRVAQRKSRLSRARMCVRACVAAVHAALTSAASAGPTDERGISFLPNLVKATGVETLLRFPSSARFDEFPVHGKSFPLRKTMNCSLQVELSTDCSAGEEDEEEKGVPATGKWIEATATVFCWIKKKNEKRDKKKLNHPSVLDEKAVKPTKLSF